MRLPKQLMSWWALFTLTVVAEPLAAQTRAPETVLRSPPTMPTIRPPAASTLPLTAPDRQAARTGLLALDTVGIRAHAVRAASGPEPLHKSNVTIVISATTLTIVLAVLLLVVIL